MYNSEILTSTQVPAVTSRTTKALPTVGPASYAATGVVLPPSFTSSAPLPALQ